MPLVATGGTAYTADCSRACGTFRGVTADERVLRGLRGLGATAFAFAVTFEVVFLIIPILGIIIPNMGSVKPADPGGFRSTNPLKLSPR
jgi:hypothetical protein